MKPLQPGDTAPDFTAEAHTGEQISLSVFGGKQAVVVYFYPKDGTTICTAEACAFRDAYEDFTKAGAAVIGISADSLESHRQFAARQRLPFLLVSDADGKLRELFRVPKTLGLLPGRVTYVIDRDGIIRHIFNSQLSGTRHVTEALETLKQIG